MKECEHNDESISRGNKVSEGSFAFVILRLAGEILKLMASPSDNITATKHRVINRDKDLSG